LLHTASKKL